MTRATIRNRNARNTSNPAKADHLENTNSKEITTMTNVRTHNLVSFSKLPALTGAPKQIAYAEKIRKSELNRINRSYFVFMEAFRGDARAERIARNAGELIVKEFCATTESKEWIENLSDGASFDRLCNDSRAFYESAREDIEKAEMLSDYDMAKLMGLNHIIDTLPVIGVTVESKAEVRETEITDVAPVENARRAKFEAKQADYLAKFEAKRAERTDKFLAKIDALKSKHQEQQSARWDKAHTRTGKAFNRAMSAINAADDKFEAKVQKLTDAFNSKEAEYKATFETAQNARAEKFEAQEAKRAEKEAERATRKAKKPAARKRRPTKKEVRAEILRSSLVSFD